MTGKKDYQDVLNFWFNESDETMWFQKDTDYDNKIRDRFGDIHSQASAGELMKWRKTIEGRLAEIIVLDQFSRNIYRDQPEAFSNDGMALVLAQEALKKEELVDLSTTQRTFLYMPFMHSESLAIHEVAMELFQEEGMETSLEFEKEHRDIIARFGRYPHRNKALNRQSTDEEQKFLSEHEDF